MGFKDKFLKGHFYKLTEKDIQLFLDEHWLEWTCKYDLTPMGHLTLIGKQSYIEGYSEEINNLISNFP